MKNENPETPGAEGVSVTPEQENAGQHGKPERETVEQQNGDGVADAVAVMTENAPEPNDAAIEQHAEQAARESTTGETPAGGNAGMPGARPEWAHLKDRNGQPFDPEKHQTNPDGSPVVSEKTGKLLMKKGRKRGGKNSASADSIVGGVGAQGKQESGQPVNPEQQARMAGKVSAHLLVTLSTMIGGEDFQPVRDQATGIDEMSALESAFGDYFVATGKTDIPPGAALTLTVAMYVVPRFTRPKVKSRLKSIGGKIYSWWHSRKSKKRKGAKASKPAQTPEDSTGTDSAEKGA